MRSFTNITGVAAALPLANVDTDKILPAAFLKTITREGLGKALFAPLRYDSNGDERDAFVLNRVPWRSASILIAHENFGCGSSREHAPWALLDFGIRCIIAPSFADIFHNNCFKNGILPIVLPRDQIDQLMEDASDPAAATLSVDLATQSITRSNGMEMRFAIDPERKLALIEGLDDIARSLECAARIAAFEVENAVRVPWIYVGVAERIRNGLGQYAA